MMGVFAEFEREIIRERVMAGLDQARAKGKKLGGPRVQLATEQQIQALRSQGMGMQRIAKEVGCGVSVVQRVLRADVS